MSRAIALTKAEQRQIDVIVEELRPWGLNYEVAKGGKHLAVKIIGPDGGHYRLTVASTPRDADQCVHFARQNARKLLRAMNSKVGL